MLVSSNGNGHRILSANTGRLFRTATIIIKTVFAKARDIFQIVLASTPRPIPTRRRPRRKKLPGLFGKFPLILLTPARSCRLPWRGLGPTLPGANLPKLEGWMQRLQFRNRLAELIDAAELAAVSTQRRA
jgi:hypothetical protein